MEAESIDLVFHREFDDSIKTTYPVLSTQDAILSLRGQEDTEKWYCDTLSSAILNVIEKYDETNARFQNTSIFDLLAGIKVDSVVHGNGARDVRTGRDTKHCNDSVADVSTNLFDADINLIDADTPHPHLKSGHNEISNALYESGRKFGSVWKDTVVRYNNPFDPRLSFEGVHFGHKHAPGTCKTEIPKECPETFNSFLDVLNPAGFENTYLERYRQHLGDLRDNSQEIAKLDLLNVPEPTKQSAPAEKLETRLQSDDVKVETAPSFVGNECENIELWSQITDTKRFWREDDDSESVDDKLTQSLLCALFSRSTEDQECQTSKLNSSTYHLGRNTSSSTDTSSGQSTSRIIKPSVESRETLSASILSEGEHKNTFSGSSMKLQATMESTENSVKRTVLIHENTQPEGNFQDNRMTENNADNAKSVTSADDQVQNNQLSEAGDFSSNTEVESTSMCPSVPRPINTCSTTSVEYSDRQVPAQTSMFWSHQQRHHNDIQQQQQHYKNQQELLQQQPKQQPQEQQLRLQQNQQQIQQEEKQLLLQQNQQQKQQQQQDSQGQHSHQQEKQELLLQQNQQQTMQKQLQMQEQRHEVPLQQYQQPQHKDQQQQVLIQPYQQPQHKENQQQIPPQNQQEQSQKEQKQMLLEDHEKQNCQEQQQETRTQLPQQCQHKQHYQQLKQEHQQQQQQQAQYPNEQWHFQQQNNPMYSQSNKTNYDQSNYSQYQEQWSGCLQQDYKPTYGQDQANLYGQDQHNLLYDQQQQCPNGHQAHYIPQHNTQPQYQTNVYYPNLQRQYVAPTYMSSSQGASDPNISQQSTYRPEYNWQTQQDVNYINHQNSVTNTAYAHFYCLPGVNIGEQSLNLYYAQKNRSQHQDLKFDDEVWYINGVPHRHAKNLQQNADVFCGSASNASFVQQNYNWNAEPNYKNATPPRYTHQAHQGTSTRYTGNERKHQNARGIQNETNNQNNNNGVAVKTRIYGVDDGSIAIASKVASESQSSYSGSLCSSIFSNDLFEVSGISSESSSESSPRETGFEDSDVGEETDLLTIDETYNTFETDSVCSGVEKCGRDYLECGDYMEDCRGLFNIKTSKCDIVGRHIRVLSGRTNGNKERIKPQRKPRSLRRSNLINII